MFLTQSCLCQKKLKQLYYKSEHCFWSKRAWSQQARLWFFNRQRSLHSHSAARLKVEAMKIMYHMKLLSAISGSKLSNVPSHFILTFFCCSIWAELFIRSSLFKIYASNAGDVFLAIKCSNTSEVLQWIYCVENEGKDGRCIFLVADSILKMRKYI